MSGGNALSKAVSSALTSPIAVVGLGYVGLPLAAEFGRHRNVIGVDVSEQRVAELKSGYDSTSELSTDQLAAARQLSFTNDIADACAAGIFIVTVPTPIDAAKQPDLTPLLGASRAVGSVLKSGDIVIYESTVYPGCTEDECVPVLESQSGLKFNEDFFVGYSPERINPGDQSHNFTSVKKVTSGSKPEIAEAVDNLYASVVVAGTHMAESIRIAEAAKVIENTQRDLNIALVNELAIIFNKLGIDTELVLAAARTKWNFLPFKPGLVGGHCIGIDPYYLAHKAELIGHHPQVIMAGRRINDGMAEYVATRLIKKMISRGIRVSGARVLVMGVTFKEDCPDTRNSKVIDVVRELHQYGANVEVYDPWVGTDPALEALDIITVPEPAVGRYDAILLAVPHKKFASESPNIRSFLNNETGVVFDLKSVLPDTVFDIRL